MKNRKWLTLALCSVTAFTAFACADDSKDNNNKEPQNTDPVVSQDGAVMSVSPASIKITTDGEKEITVTYKVDGVATKGKGIVFKSKDESCATVSEPEVSTSTDAGTAKVTIAAAGKECNTKISITDKEEKADALLVSVTVTDGGNVTPTGNPQITVITPADKFLPFDKKDEKKTATVMYIDENSQPVDNSAINIETSNKDCVKASSAKQTTDSNGKASFELKAAGDNCSATITFKTSDASATIQATVGEVPDYFVNLNVNYYNNADNNVGARVGQVAKIVFGATQDGTCPTADNMAKADIDFLEDKSIVPEDTSANPLYAYDNFALPKDLDSSAVAGYAIDASSNVLAYGCTDGITQSDSNSGIDLDLREVPILFKNSYTVYTNFDFSSGFQKTGKLKVEEMGAGDWIGFMVDFCKDPLKILLNFAWENTILRLSDIPALAEYKETIDKYISGATKDIAIAAITPALEKYLEEYGWYKILKEVAPDVADLTTNMQFKGTFNFKDANYAQGTITGVAEDYKSIHYQWSYSGIDMSCLAPEQTYAKASSCRVNMPLGNDGITGKWNGSVASSSAQGVDGELSINAHSIELKWANILYTAVFGHILPKALGYSTSKSLGNGRYLTAFLENVLFKLYVDYYNESCAGKKACNENDTESTKTTVYPALKSEELCEQFVEGILNAAIHAIVDKDLSSVTGTIGMYACGDQALGQLDKLVETQLSSFALTTENGLNISSKDCPLHAEDNEYTEIGRADTTPYSAYEVFSDSKKTTTRCKYDASFTMGETPVTLHGLMHGTAASK